jgi:hypothetical protein
MVAQVFIIAYHDDVLSCTKHELHPIDWQHAMTRPDAAKWSLAPQSGTVVDRTNAGRTAANVAKWSYPPAILLL